MGVYKIFQFGLISGAMTVALTTPSFAQAQDGMWDHATTEVVAGNASAWPTTVTGVVVDDKGAALKDAAIIIDGQVVQTDVSGRFAVATRGSRNGIMVLKAGFRKALITPTQSSTLRIQLKALAINGMYASWALLDKSGAYTPSAKIVKLESYLQTTEMNALVFDFKSDDGYVERDMRAVIDHFHKRGIYMIARIVSFKDRTAVAKHPELGIQDIAGGPWKGKHGDMFLNPYNPDARQYLVNVAVQAAQQGFDEVQFDYVRFPTDGDLKRIAHDRPSTPDNRTSAIAAFMREARAAVEPYGVFLAADVFGDTAWVKESSDSGIGQRIADITAYLDYVCPMVYPSGYANNTGFKGRPVDDPEQIVALSIRRYRLRASDDTVIRPWLQAFVDYAFRNADGSHNKFYGPQIVQQITGSDKEGGVGYLLWNAGVNYELSTVPGKKATAHTSVSPQ